MIHSRLDICSPLYYGLPVYSIQEYQLIMNSAFRLIFRLSSGSTTANYIKQFFWLPMKLRVLYKILLLITVCVTASPAAKFPVYLGTLVFLNDKVTRCQYAYNLKVPIVRTAFGWRSFSFAFPFEWNKLPFEIKLIPHEFDYRKITENFFI